jgi:hypothetical protein
MLWILNSRLAWLLLLYSLEAASYFCWLASGYLIGSALVIHYEGSWKRLSTILANYGKGSSWSTALSTSWHVIVILIRLLFGIKLSQSRVGYIVIAQSPQPCKLCPYFLALGKDCKPACRLVKGPISPEGHCQEFAA